MSQPPRAAQQRAATQRVQQVRRSLRDQQRHDQQRLDQQRQSVQQRQAVQQRRAVQSRRTQHRGLELRRQLEVLRQQQQRWRVWQSTAAKRAARQIETEQAIVDRERRLRAARTEQPTYGREPENYETYVRRRHAEARDATLAATTRTSALDEVWATALAGPLHVSFGSMRRRVSPVPFDAGDLAKPLAEPRAEDYQPADALLPAWVPGQRAARERARVAAYAEYRRAVADHRAAEFDRVRRLSVAKLRHQREQADATAAAHEHNAAVDRLRAGYGARDPAAVEEFARIVLSARAWPDGVVLRWRLRYRPDFRQIDAECALPGPEIVPGVRRYRYVAAADAIRRQLVPDDELRRRYERLVEQVALTALADLFHAMAPDVVDVVHLNGRRAAPRSEPPSEPGPYLISVAAARSEWDALHLHADEPRTLLDSLDARISPDAYNAVPITPWAELP